MLPESVFHQGCKCFHIASPRLDEPSCEFPLAGSGEARASPFTRLVTGVTLSASTATSQNHTLLCLPSG